MRWVQLLKCSSTAGTRETLKNCTHCLEDWVKTHSEVSDNADRGELPAMGSN